ncbi:M1 family metallopeptidase [Lacihabitans soyangensis]|uniref:M1 family peptidase n=1 Tax=Lacihabitans soyangensis TaxID=869394 RepID=A0AAE3H269_9BACT|nr:M1 family metallopeptidase [Lacihabitans soyangensis]MCP9762614.1 M1 family peptidase [Lacihabitans soyangensis]
MKKLFLAFSFLFSTIVVVAQGPSGTTYNANTRFEQLGGTLPTPNTFRTASGAPGKDYFQNKADYDIKAELDDVNQRIIGSEIITYTNFSTDDLKYLWLQLDQNLFQKNSINALGKTGGVNPQMSSTQLNGMNSPSSVNTTITAEKEYGYKIKSVKDLKGANIPYTINGTMMRVDIPVSLKPTIATSIKIEWEYNITEYYGRSGYEFFEKDGNYNYFIAHWFPRMCVYDDVSGWQNKQFLGQGEFTLPFGDYKVEITVPDDHILGATGECQNYAKVLSKVQQQRMKEASTSKTPVILATQAEAEERMKFKSTNKQTWIFTAKKVRDFAFATSRRFIWDAMQTDVYGNGKKIWSMSFYSKEGNPLWEKYSTRVVEHTLRSYGQHTIEYPYPVAISCHATRGGGMEYPMISFNGGRPEPDGTYSEGTKYGMIGVIIHEVGHNFFPMIVNSDERQWSWMDEGLNTFCQYLAEKEWDKDYPARRGEPQDIVPYMKTDKTQQVPIMSSSDNIMAFGPNAYAKPATGLNMLRETIMGRELFDAAFKEYARRWAFKSPMPADFFRTMEDASGVDLDWFWKGWFYTVEPVDQDLAEVQWYSLDTQNPELSKAEIKKMDEAKAKTMSKMRDKKDIPQSVVEADPSMKDFYNSYDRYAVTEADKKKYEAYKSSLSPDDQKLLESGMNYYVLKIKNKGGLVMPVIVQAVYEDGTTEDFRYPAEIWRLNDVEITKTIPTKKKVEKFKLDPYMEIADIDTANNSFPKEPEAPTKFQLMKQRSFGPQGLNPMQEAKKNDAAGVGSSGRN